MQHVPIGFIDYYGYVVYMNKTIVLKYYNN